VKVCFPPDLHVPKGRQAAEYGSALGLASVVSCEGTNVSSVRNAAVHRRIAE